MNIFDLLNARKTELYRASSEIRDKISQIIDDKSFVELNAYSFNVNEFYNENEQGLGVVTGYATINDNPIYIVAQNAKVLSGGLSKANADKICACLEKAYGTKTPVLYLLDSQGVQVGEGVSVLEGIASILEMSNDLKDVAPQFAVSVGDVLGSTALLFANADFSYVVGSTGVSYGSPAVISASTKKSVSKEELCGNKAVNGVRNFAVKDLSEVKEGITKILDILPNVSGYVVDTEDDLNRTSPKLNEKACPKCIIDAVYDKNSFVELGKGFVEEIITGIGRVGGVSTAVLAFDGGEEGVELDLNNVLKITNFLNFVADNDLPLLTFVNVKGIKQDVETANSQVMQEVMNMLYTLGRTTRISVVYGKTIGLGYTAFASRKFGNAYTYAFANAKISLFDGEVGTAVEFGTVSQDRIGELKEKYANMQDAFNSAKIGCVDNVIEPQFVRQFVISALQTIIK